MMNSTSQVAAASVGGDSELVALVPRVNIHAFYDNQQTTEVMQSPAAYKRILLINQFVARPSGTNP